jgi:hypothetical protein
MNIIKTKYGDLEPKFEQSTVRCKDSEPYTLYSDGNIYKIYLNSQTKIDTPIGSISAELISFYKNGNIKRIFPLNGKISGYWSEDDEYEMSEKYSLKLPFGKIDTKIVSLHFYESGAVKSLTLWPKDKIKLNTPIGIQTARYGLSMFPDGKLKSFEPLFPIDVKTKIGEISAYNLNAHGVNGDENSFNLYETGKIKSLITSTSKLEITEKNKKFTYSPKYYDNNDYSNLYFKPLKLLFINNNLIVNDTNCHSLNSKFEIGFIQQNKNNCSSCSSCNQCS